VKSPHNFQSRNPRVRMYSLQIRLFYFEETCMIAIDYESYLIGDGAVFPKPVCLSWYDGKNTGLLNREESKEFLSEHLNNVEIIAHNAVFECGVTITHYPELDEQVFDALDNGMIYCTKVNEALWNNQREKQLNKL